MERIYSDQEVFEQIKDKSRKAYIRAWKEFKLFNTSINYEESPPGEDAMIAYFKHLRLEKKSATSSMWTTYSYLNSVLKRKYGVKLQSLPRVTMFIKGFEEDTKQKAAIFDNAILHQFLTKEMDTAYWEVRQSIAITAFFGGLRLAECMDLKLEQFIRSTEGYSITHTRAKQRTDKMSTKFLVPEEGGYAKKLEIYLSKVNNQLSKFQGRVWYTGRKHVELSSQYMGRNMVAKVPHKIAALYSIPDPMRYTFHSFRRTSATSAADAGATTEQLVDFFGWKNGSMCQEYISSSKPSIIGMASRLSGSEAYKEDKINTCQEVVIQPEQSDKFDQMDEDLEMYSKAGIPLTSHTTTSEQQSIVETSIKQALSSVRATNGANVTLKVVVINSMYGNMTM